MEKNNGCYPIKVEKPAFRPSESLRATHYALLTTRYSLRATLYAQRLRNILYFSRGSIKHYTKEGGIEQ